MKFPFYVTFYEDSRGCLAPHILSLCAPLASDQLHAPTALSGYDLQYGLQLREVLTRASVLPYQATVPAEFAHLITSLQIVETFGGHISRISPGKVLVSCLKNSLRSRSSGTPFVLVGGRKL
jgi:hypothetical protein